MLTGFIHNHKEQHAETLSRRVDTVNTLSFNSVITSILFPNSLQRGPCPSCITCLAPVAALWWVTQEEGYHLKVGGWLLLAGMLLAGHHFCVSLLKFTEQSRRQYQQVNECTVS